MNICNCFWDGNLTIQHINEKLLNFFCKSSKNIVLRASRRASDLVQSKKKWMGCSYERDFRLCRYGDGHKTGEESFA